ncbi:DUF3780 domain-containing protein [uncultured Dialister sp.]|uniref:DUF3780 domain-containing protein n=1 Tax=Dialister hominis TaxID=2582419 RepID=UPI0026DF2E4A|nr:DUF3780 domain-containing protein [uncultured Dialister sp.]
MKKDYIGFGFNPKEGENHFYVVIPADEKESVSVYERFHWDTEGDQKIENSDILKLQLSRQKWAKVSISMQNEFNNRLKADHKPKSRFTKGGNAVNKMFGKEMMVLLWAIETNEIRGIPVAIRNWLGLRPEERWWLYTMTNASTGDKDDHRGWRIALKYALCENPVDEAKQMSFEDYIGDKIDG